MKINIIAVGKVKETFFAEAAEEYKKRLSKFCDVSVTEVPEETNISSPKQKSEAEGKSILKKCDGYVICLDRGGKLVSSEELSEIIEGVKLSGQSKINFIIGGSNGISDEVKNRANLVISFGKVTYPHTLFRVILLEQIYRAFTIGSNLPYHK